MAAAYPSADPSFTTKTNSDTVQAAHMNAVQDEVIAIGSALRGTCDHDLKLASGHNFYEGGSSTMVGGWTTFTATWGAPSAPTLGNATVTARYTRIGKTVKATLIFQFGSSSNGGSGTWTFALPSTAATGLYGGGSVRVLDSGTRWFLGVPYLASTTTVSFQVTDAAGTGVETIDATHPMTWAAGDTFYAYFWYEEA